MTAAMAGLVFVTVLLVDFAKHGLRLLKAFVPEGIPIVILPLVVLIEITSFLSQPVSHSCAASRTCWRGTSASKFSLDVS